MKAKYVIPGDVLFFCGTPFTVSHVLRTMINDQSAIRLQFVETKDMSYYYEPDDMIEKA